MNEPLQYAFIDESGTVAPFSGSQFFVVVQIRTAHPRSLEIQVKRTRQKQGKNLASSEMKASTSKAVIVEHLLSALAQESISINAVIVDKRVIVRPPTDAEQIYRTAMAQAVYHAASVHSRLDVYLDRRYTTQRQCNELERAIREQIASLPKTVVLLRQEDSIRHRRLQAADFVAWAFFQKYEREDERFY